MKRLAVICLMVLPVAATAQDSYQGMSEADMQRMMEQGQKMQACMSRIDQAELEVLEQRSLKTEDEIRSLCNSGKRDQALQKAMAFGREVNDAKVMQQIRECTAMMEGMMQMMPQIPFSGGNEETAGQHVCDGI